MSEDRIGIGMIGCGTVGGGVAAMLRDHAELYTQRTGRRIELRRVLVRDCAKAVRAGHVAPDVLTDDADAFFDADTQVVIEVAGGRGAISEYVRRALSTGRHVVTANKSLLAAEGPELFRLAREHNVAIAFEASCAGGIPVITALQFGLMANDIAGLYGILNGTCNYILTQMTRAGKTYDEALAEAQQHGYAEADPTLDVSGVDAAQKLAILASLAFGTHVGGDQVPAVGIDGLDLADIRFGLELGYDIKLLAIAERGPDQQAVSACVQPCFVHDRELLAQVDGPFNALSVFGDAVGHTLYYGAGAGRMPTASAVVSDLLNIVSGWYPQAFAQLRLTPDHASPAQLVPLEQLESRFYIRLNALDVPGVLAKVTRILGDANISISSVLQHESAVGQYVPLVITTHDARQGDLDTAAQQIESLDVIDGQPVLIRIVDLPR